MEIGLSFTCPKCGRTSHHPEDEAQGYCGHCHAFTREEPAASYQVVLADGPAQKWSYVTFVPPEQIILIARNPVGGVHGEWMRVPMSNAWEDALEYRRRPLDSYGTRSEDGDVIVLYYAV
jgi:hypothetical protein